MKADSASTALNQTLGQLQGGILRIGDPGDRDVGADAPVLRRAGAGADSPESWHPEKTLANLTFDSNEVGQLLATLGGQVQAEVATPYGLPIAVPLTQLGVL